MSWIKEQFVLLRQYLRSGFRHTLLLCALGMLAAALAGFIVGLLFPQQASQVMTQFMEQIEESGVIDGSGALSVFALLMNNWRAMLFSAAYGVIPFVFLPLLSLIMNGVLLGLLAALFQAGGTSLLVYLAGILPHGIFEIPALVFSIACGVTLCMNLTRMATGNPKKRPVLPLLEDLLRVLVLVVAPMTVAAAFIECYVTPVVMGMAM